MAVAVEITRQDMIDFLAPQGFQEVPVPGTREMVMSRVVNPDLCLRVFTSIVGNSSRGVGEDAIRVTLATRLVGGEIKIVGCDTRVHRVVGWKKNLQDRLDSWREQLGPSCPLCGCGTVRRSSKRGPFWGCCRYPACRTVQPINETRRDPLPKPANAEWASRLAEKAAFQDLENQQERAAYEAEMRRDEETERRRVQRGVVLDRRAVLASVMEGDDPPPQEW